MDFLNENLYHTREPWLAFWKSMRC